MNHILKCHDRVEIDFVRGENCHLYDRDGNRYLDLESGIWCTGLGHGHPRINQVIQAQIELITHLGTRYPSALAEAAINAILDIAGVDDGKGVFLSSGSEAVELGVESARRTTGKRLLLTFSNSYLAAYGSAGHKSTDEWCLPDWRGCDQPDPGECLSSIPFEEIGAFVFEPGGSGSAFVQFPSRKLVEEIARRVKNEGGLVMANEVTTGMGRTGRWFGFQHYDVEPDIVALGKGLGNGYPVSALVMTRTVGETLESTGLRYAQSHQNDPLGCRIAREVIAILREENWIERGRTTGERFLEGLKRLETKHEVVKEARGRGMLLGLELHSHVAADMVYEVLLEDGFLVGCYPAGNMLRFDPALTIEEEHISSFIESLDSALSRLGAGTSLERPIEM